ncbi:hypothetical protein [Anaerotruncus sp.]|uniref:hypothetical protein n=1 Tax=Anaerotruncus sp. TaxID=1872531 RepID=UPI0025BF2A04|nr:hypothetical protein [Anaerotruncus sp.]
MQGSSLIGLAIVHVSRYNMRSANGKAVCSRHPAASAAKQRTAHVAPQPKPAKPVSLPLCGRQAQKGLPLWYNNRKAIIIPGHAQRLAAYAATAF